MSVLFPRRVVAAAWLITANAVLAAPPESRATAVADTAAPERIATATRLLRPKRVVVEGWTHPLADTKLTDLTGHEVTGRLGPEAGTGKVSVSLADDLRPFVVKTRKVANVALAKQGQKTILPGGLVMPLVPQGESGGPASMAWFRLTCSASPQPAAWADSVREYTTLLTFGVQLSPGAPASLQLPSPVTVKLDFEGLTAPALPAFTIDEAGLAAEKTVELRFLPSTNQPKLRVRSTIAEADLPLAALPRLELRPQQSRVLGLGLEAVDVGVERVLPDGTPEPVKTATRVDVQVEGGLAQTTPDVITMAAGSSRADFAVRSAGLGVVTLRATAGGVGGSVLLDQRFPAGPLLAALLGGALGGFARRWAKSTRKGAVARHTVEGIFVGLVAFVAAVLGVGYLSLPSAIAATEAGAFLTGALCGFVGVTVLSALTKKLRPAAAE